MANWKYRINIKQYLSDEETQEAMQKALDGIESELAKIPLHVRIGSQGILEMIKVATIADDLELFNDSLNDLYDWADDKRVWLGLMD